MVKALPTDDRPRNDGLTFRQRLEKHREDPSCASCHARLDPLGFGLEHFDAIGRWRDQINDKPIDAAGELTTGESFVGAAALKAILLESKRDLFVRNFVERLLSYALHRGVEYYDAPTVNQLFEELQASEFRAASLVVAVVKSLPFQYRRGGRQEAN